MYKKKGKKEREFSPTWLRGRGGGETPLPTTLVRGRCCFA